MCRTPATLASTSTRARLRAAGWPAAARGVRVGDVEVESAQPPGPGSGQGWVCLMSTAKTRRTLGQQPRRRCPADAGIGAGDHGDLVAESHGVTSRAGRNRFGCPAGDLDVVSQDTDPGQRRSGQLFLGVGRWSRGDVHGAKVGPPDGDARCGRGTGAGTCSATVPSARNGLHGRRPRRRTRRRRRCLPGARRGCPQVTRCRRRSGGRPALRIDVEGVAVDHVRAGVHKVHPAGIR